MQNNALLFMKYVKANYPTVTLNAICGIIGNCEKESTINSGRYQSDSTSSTTNGYGFIQWTPWNTKIGSSSWLTTFGASNKKEPEYQIRVIMAMLGMGSNAEVSLLNGNWINRSGGYSVTGLGGQWYPYMTKSAYLTSTASAYDLGLVFHACAEGSADGTNKITARGNCCQSWFDFLLPYWNGQSEQSSVSETTTGEEIPLESDDTGKTELTQKNKLLRVYSNRNTYKYR